MDVYSNVAESLYNRTRYNLATRTQRLYCLRPHYDLSGKPKSTPNAGYTNRVTPLTLCTLSSAATSDESSFTIFAFSSILELVTLLGRTAWPLATAEC